MNKYFPQTAATTFAFISVFILLQCSCTYRKDSGVPEGTLYDLMVAIDQIQRGERKEPTLFVRAEKVSKTADIAQ